MANFLALNAGRIKQVSTIQTSAGVADADNMISLNAAGEIDNSIMPLQGANLHEISAVASEALDAYRLVNFHLDAGVLKVRHADASLKLPAHGVVTVVGAAGDIISVHTQPLVKGMLISGGSSNTGSIFYLNNAGTLLTTAPTLSGSIVQKVGIRLQYSNDNAFLFTPMDYSEIL